MGLAGEWCIDGVCKVTANDIQDKIIQTVKIPNSKTKIEIIFIIPDKMKNRFNPAQILQKICSTASKAYRRCTVQKVAID